MVGGAPVRQLDPLEERRAVESGVEAGGGDAERQREPRVRARRPWWQPGSEVAPPLRDGANRRIDNVRRSGDGFVAVSPDDGARYDVQPDQLTISSNGSVDSAEPSLEYGSAQ